MKTLFDEMAIFSPNRTKRIIEEIEYEVTTGFVKVNLTTSVNDADFKDLKYFIRIENLHQWLTDEGQLDRQHDYSHTVTGEHIQETHTVGIVDFIRNELTDNILYDYLTAKGTINLEYRPV